MPTAYHEAAFPAHPLENTSPRRVLVDSLFCFSSLSLSLSLSLVQVNTSALGKKGASSDFTATQSSFGRTGLAHSRVTPWLCPPHFPFFFSSFPVVVCLLLCLQLQLTPPPPTSFPPDIQLFSFFFFFHYRNMTFLSYDIMTCCSIQTCLPRSDPRRRPYPNGCDAVRRTCTTPLHHPVLVQHDFLRACPPPPPLHLSLTLPSPFLSPVLNRYPVDSWSKGRSLRGSRPHPPLQLPSTPNSPSASVPPPFKKCCSSTFSQHTPPPSPFCALTSFPPCFSLSNNSSDLPPIPPMFRLAHAAALHLPLFPHLHPSQG